jgi:hypothetical protein
MIELQSDKLAVSFPKLPLQPRLTIDFQRTLRIPDDGRDYPLPPGLGSFPLRHIDDFAPRVPGSWLRRGGVLLPMWQAEALWLKFDTRHIGNRETSYPFAIKVATGKISALTGEAWQGGLSRNPQNYLVAPRQPWLDGYCVEKGIIRQFVAMPLGEGYSVEEQVTGAAEFGGLQIEVFPMRAEVFEKRFPVRLRKERALFAGCITDLCCRLSEAGEAMGLAPGGRMRQEIYNDPYSIHDWDTERGSRCFIHLVNSTTWQAITGQRPPSSPPAAAQYSQAGYPWFDYYDAEAKAVRGSKVLAAVKSVFTKGQEKAAAPLPENASVSVTNLVHIKSDLQRGQVREGEWEG